MVVVAIIGIVSLIVLTNQSTFNKTLILQNTAYDIALTLRDAETYGLGSRAIGITANAGYGVHFQNAPTTSFILFADTYPSTPSASNCHGVPIDGASAPDAQPGDCIYTSSQDQKINAYTLGNGITVSDFCVFNGSWSCAQNNGLTSLDIVFARPNPATFISVNGSYSAAPAVTAACLTVSASEGGKRFVSVASSGEITANATSCP